MYSLQLVEDGQYFVELFVIRSISQFTSISICER